MSKTNKGITTITQIEKAIKQAIKDGKTTIKPLIGYKGLELRIRPHKDRTDATADFRHRYTHPITGKRPYMTLGQYPALTLADARQMHSDNMALLVKGIDPIEHRDNQKQKELIDRMNTLDHFINEWENIRSTKNLKPVTIEKTERLLRPIRQQLGHMRVTDITPSIVIQFINGIQEKTPNKGLRVKTALKSILQLALKHRVIESNPASDLQGTLKTPKTKHLPAITNPEPFAKLLREIDQLDDAGQLYNKSILQLLALTCARIGDVVSMQWADINWLTKQWQFKPQKAGNRGDMVADMVIPLAPQAIEILKKLQKFTGDKDHVFYNSRRKLAPYHNPEEVNKVLNSGLMNDGRGYKGIHSPHGFRSSAKTMLMERRGYDELITELALGHTMLNKYGRAYNRMAGIDQRTKMMNDWANYLDDLRAGKFDNMIYADFNQQKAQNG
ncbi:tyrosine-type recombinase/integrase [Psychrobacter phenylpyruvicus]|uniref:Prophage CP4-57 integrase n=1 Tax=Psychrobacter phenylpyruvicus TaxID=29432 RepID=A0A379LNA8_9GAMM|nr:integrase arm-type DNA-binding domain-containing protein [Psychrobacter phenylpyruvicus]SUD92070.1 Prophage CP4-57 integrase [Psychrobacter phenylpyruvicus]